MHHSPNSDSSKKLQYLLRNPTSVPPLHHHKCCGGVFWLAHDMIYTLMPSNALCGQLLHSLAQTLSSSQHYTMKCPLWSALAFACSNSVFLKILHNDVNYLICLCIVAPGYTPNHADKTRKGTISRLSSTLSRSKAERGPGRPHIAVYQHSHRKLRGSSRLWHL